ncbi:11811_t:CDS:2 [Ambispora gerdemannii]|uniref:11811_t:CDS:1 n=1 Tax=Ambispora gerdemannii TaxID=144530 RepID=A0A9N9C850_9GLOM|nr:11811_t:CDS:2 [Ambispora gerdemannii]
MSRQTRSQTRQSQPRSRYPPQSPPQLPPQSPPRLPPQSPPQLPPQSPPRLPPQSPPERVQIILLLQNEAKKNSPSSSLAKKIKKLNTDKLINFLQKLDLKPNEDDLQCFHLLTCTSYIDSYYKE